MIIPTNKRTRVIWFENLELYCYSLNSIDRSCK